MPCKALASLVAATVLQIPKLVARLDLVHVATLGAVADPCGSVSELGTGVYNLLDRDTRVIRPDKHGPTNTAVDCYMSKSARAAMGRAAAMAARRVATFMLRGSE